MRNLQEYFLIMGGVTLSGISATPAKYLQSRVSPSVLLLVAISSLHLNRENSATPAMVQPNAA